MTTEDVKNEDLERLWNISEGIAFTIFGFGTEPLEFARRLTKLRDDEPANYDLLNDIAQRLVFINQLRYKIAAQSGDMGTTFRIIVDSNIDALETYLLCTCIDAIAGGREYVEFPDWLDENMDEMERKLKIGVFRSLFTILQHIFRQKTINQNYLDITHKLFEEYKDSEVGLTRKFRELFENLPESLKDLIVDRFIWTKGDWASSRYQDSVKRWVALSTNDKIKKLATEYLYGFRRSKYTHAARLSDPTRPGWIRRVEETRPNVGGGDSKGWRFAKFQKTKKKKPQVYTLWVRSDTDENLMWRTVIYTTILRDYLKYSVNKEYLEALLKYFKGIDSTYAFMGQMEENWHWFKNLTTPEYLEKENRFLNYEISKFETDTGKKLVEEFGDIIGKTSLEDYISGYLHNITSLNEIINKFDEEYPPKASVKRQQALSKLATNLSVYDFSWYSQMIYLNFERMMEHGGLHRHSNIVLVN